MNKTALITGAACGIGKEFSRIHASKGGNILAVDINTEGMELLKDEFELKYNTNIYIITKDLTDVDAPKQIYDELRRQVQHK